MPKPSSSSKNQPLQAVRRGIRAMSTSAPLRGIRSLSPATKRKSGKTGKYSGKGGQGVADEVMQQQQQQQHRDSSNSNARRHHQQEERDQGGTSRGRALSGNGRDNGVGVGGRDQPASPSKRTPPSVSLDAPPPKKPPGAVSSPIITVAKNSSSSLAKRQQQKQQQFFDGHPPPHPPRSPKQHRHAGPSRQSQLHTAHNLADNSSSSSDTTTSFSRSQMIENPSSASDSYSQPHRQASPLPVVGAAALVESSWTQTASSSSTPPDDNDWIADFAADINKDNDPWGGFPAPTSTTTASSKRTNSRNTADSLRKPILPPPHDTRNTSAKASPARHQQHRSGLPKSSRDHQHPTTGATGNGGGFLNTFFGGSTNNAKKASLVAADLLEIGSEATLTAGDLMVEDSMPSTEDLESETPTPPQQPRQRKHKQQGQPKQASNNSNQKGVFFPNDPANNITSRPSKKSTPSSPKAVNTATTSPHNKKKPKALTGEYLQSKLMQLESVNNNNNNSSAAMHSSSALFESHASQDESDDHTEVSNLTNPTVFDTTAGSPTKSSAPSPMGPPLALPKSPSKSSTMTKSRAAVSAGRSSSVRSSKHQTASDPFDGPSLSWGEGSIPQQGHNHNDAALGRALDMQFISSSPGITADDSAVHRPPLLPKATTATSSAGASPAQTMSRSESLSSRRQRARSRTPSPSPATRRNSKTAAAPQQSSNRTPSPASQRRTSTTPRSSSGSKQPLPTARHLSPFQRSMGAANKGNQQHQRKSNTAKEDWGKFKDNMLEQRVVESKSSPKNRPSSRSSSNNKAARKPSPVASASSGRKQNRSASAAPEKKRVNTAVEPKGTMMDRARSKSAARAQSQSRRQESPQQLRRGLHTVKGAASPMPSKHHHSSPRRGTISRDNTSTAPSQMEPLSQVMSRVPSNLSSRGSASASNNARAKGAVGRSPSPSTRKSTRSATPQLKDSIELKRQASRSSGRAGSNSRDRNAAQKAGNSRDMQREKKAMSKKHQVVPVEKKEKLFPTNLGQLKAMRSPGRSPKAKPVVSKPSYLPTNVYAGRFTPKKKKDKLTDIMATREEEVEEYSYALSTSPTRKQVPRHVGAQKLRNMIKLKNHFTSDSSCSPLSDRALLTTPQKARASSNDRMTMIREHGLIDSFSVGGSDLRSLRSAVQSRFSDHDQVELYRNDSYFERYDETNTSDPMQSAGIRLLSAAVIPIQAAARRFLARREALSLLWGALVIQARVRSSLEQTRYEIKVYATIRIQAAARGMLVRDRLMFEDYCATEIQRYVRGHMAAVRVYESVYKISLVQSQVRMRLAIRDATIRMYCVLKLQSVARGFLVRTRLRDANDSARDIQRCVRGYLATMHVYEEIYKITLVQNRVRSRQAIDKATIRMSLVLSLQAIARGYLVRCRLELAHYHAGTIQRYVRGYIGTMRVYEEIYKIMIIQNFFRMKIANNLATKRMTMIISVQANWRRYCVMRRMEYAHFNAEVIQRYVRGYLSTMTVYEEIYTITLVQNFVRMKQAKSLAGQRGDMILKTQAIVRGFILRSRLTKIREKAITIQTVWRSFYYRLVYQFRLLDIIIVQSVWRRRAACCIAKQKRRVLQEKAATVVQSRWRCYDAHETYLQYKIENRAGTIIQTRWRCYDTSMDYLHYLADVLIVQSMVRRWFAMREVTSILEDKSIVLQRVARGYLGRIHVRKVKSAIVIQKTWRGFVSFADYMFKVADIVIMQTLARRWIAYRRADYLRHKIDHDAATVIQQCRHRQLYRRERSAVLIQKVWRGLVQEADFVITLYEYRAARSIQTSWRRFWKFSNYLICLDCSIRIQAVTRGFLARCKYTDKQWGAVILQATARGIIGKRRATSKKMLEAQTLTSHAIGSLQSMAATVVQASLRGFQVRGAHEKFMAARLIQTHFRGYIFRVGCKQHESAMEIQKHWRRVIYHAAYKRFLAARCIQNFCRSVHSRKAMLCRKAENVAATIIQSSWRGYLYYTHYLFSLCDIVKVQSIARQYLAKKNAFEIRHRTTNSSAVAIQKSWRGFYSHTCYWITLSEIVRLQRLARRYVAKRRYLSHHVTTIQNAWRGFYCHSNYNFTVKDVVKIQSSVRRKLAQLEFRRSMKHRRLVSAMLLQRVWRGYFCRSNYSFIVSDIVKVQSEARRYLAQKVFLALWEDHAIKSVVKLQSQWRSYSASIKYAAVRMDIIRVQTAGRALSARRTLLQRQEEHRCQSAIVLQRSWRGYKYQKMYHGAVSNICFLQYQVRCFLAFKEKERQSAALIQTIWRGYWGYSTYSLNYYDIVKVQSIARALIARKNHRQLCLERDHRAANKIQAAFRGWNSYADYVCKKSAVLDVQRYWRGFSGRIGLFVAWKRHVARIHASATQVQKVWRGYVTTQRYLYKLGSAIEIQSLARMVIVQARHRRRKEAATTIQSLRRKFLARHVMLDLFSKHTFMKSKLIAASSGRAARTVQKWWRMFLRRKLQAKGAVTIQCFMKYAAAKRFLEKQIAARRICLFFHMAYEKRLSPVERLAIKMNECATQIQRWYPHARRLRARRRVRAGRVILRFFRMIQAEVDRAIEMELKRRKQRKVLKKRTQKKDDAILETAWEKASGTGLERYRRRGGPTPRSGGDAMLQDTLTDIKSRTRCNQYASTSPRNQNMKPRPTMLSLADALDDGSVATGCMSPAGAMSPLAQAFNRPSPSRMSSFSQKDFDEDYCLEEAFLDAEINSAKYRRHSEKINKSKSSGGHRKSSSGSVSSRVSVGSKVSASSRRSTTSTGTRESRDTRASRGGGGSSSSRTRGGSRTRPEQQPRGR